MNPTRALPPLDRDAVVGCLLGQAVGDMMGLPAENLSARRIAKWFPKFDRPRFLFGYGMGSDDTEHACMTANALLRSGGDRHRFRRSLAWRLRWWFLAGPPGIGKATLKACVKLWLGWSSNYSGVKSAGNGPTMRAAILFTITDLPDEWDDENLDHTSGSTPWIGDVTGITHRDPQAYYGALFICNLACLAARGRKKPFDPATVLNWCDPSQHPSSTPDLGNNLAAIPQAYRAGKSVAEFVEQLGLKRKGVTGYIAHTVPVAIYAFLRHPDDYRAAVESVIRCGGDTDTVAAITGALVGIRVGKAGIPKEWLDRWCDWPRSIRYIEKLGERLAEGKWRTAPQPAVGLAWWAIPFRNLMFFVVVLCHAVRRLFPPY